MELELMGGIYSQKTGALHFRSSQKVNDIIKKNDFM